MKNKLDEIINGIDTPMGKAFDILLILSVSISSTLIVIDSVESIHLTYGIILNQIQFVFLIFFTLEYILRCYIAPKRRSYILSFYGIIDLLAILPAFLGFFFAQRSFFPIIRILRLLRLFSIFKMGRYMDESGVLLKALKASKVKISVFLITIIFIVIIVGSLMFVIEGPQNGFNNIPESMYWSVVTISTVGYGDISPQTPIGKIIASSLMLVGYGIIAVPTGIITSEITMASRDYKAKNRCPICGQGKHIKGAKYCHQCGYRLN